MKKKKEQHFSLLWDITLCKSCDVPQVSNNFSFFLISLDYYLDRVRGLDIGATGLLYSIKKKNVVTFFVLFFFLLLVCGFFLTAFFFVVILISYKKNF